MRIINIHQRQNTGVKTKLCVKKTNLNQKQEQKR